MTSHRVQYKDANADNWTWFLCYCNGYIINCSLGYQLSQRDGRSKGRERREGRARRTREKEEKREIFPPSSRALSVLARLNSPLPLWFERLSHSLRSAKKHDNTDFNTDEGSKIKLKLTSLFNTLIYLPCAIHERKL